MDARISEGCRKICATPTRRGTGRATSKIKNQNSEIASSPDPIENQKSKFKIPKSRRTGKIARLPKKLRDLINELLSDGATYAQIIQRLNESTDPPLPYHVAQKNISQWHDGGYQDWLQHQDRMEFLASKLDFALDLARNSQPEKLQELSLQLAAIRLCEFLSDLAIAEEAEISSASAAAAMICAKRWR
jgi:hypothetical protein